MCILPKQDNSAAKAARAEAERQKQAEQDARAREKADTLEDRRSGDGAKKFSALARAAFQPAAGQRSFFQPTPGGGA